MKHNSQQYKTKLLLVCIICLSLMDMKAQTWTAPALTCSTLATGTTYYMYNVGSNGYLSRGGYWLTQAVVTTSPTANASTTIIKWTATNTTGSIWTFQYNSNGSNVTNNFLFPANTSSSDGSVYTDNSTSDTWNVVQTDATNKIYSIQVVSSYGGYVGTQYLGTDVNPEVANLTTKVGGSGTFNTVRYNRVSSSYTQWKFITQADLDLYNAKVLLDRYMTYATAGGMDVSSYITTYNAGVTADINAAASTLLIALGRVDVTTSITNPSFENVTFPTGWTNSGSFASQSNVPGQGWTKDGTYYAEKFIASGFGTQGNGVKGYLAAGTITQNVTGLSNGMYELVVSAHAVQQAGANPLHTGAFITAGAATTEVAAGRDYTIGNINVSTGSLTVGYSLTGTITCNWTGFDNFRLYYYCPSISSLQTVINTAQALHDGVTEGNAAGQYLPGSKTTFLAVINSAQTTHDTPGVTFPQVSAAIVALNAATTAFNSGKEGTQVELDQLTTTIASANSYYTASVAGTNPGQYAAADRTTLNNAISAAQTILVAHNSTSTQLVAGNTTLTAALATFRNLVVSRTAGTANFTDGKYFISVTGGSTYYFTDKAPHTAATGSLSANDKPIDFEALATGDNLKYQVFKFTYDATKSRYRIDGQYRVDTGTGTYANTHVNESGYFGSFTYSNAWNSFTLKYDGTHYTIQRGESAGTNYWTPASYSLGAVTAITETNLYNSLVYTLTPAITIAATSNDVAKGTVTGGYTYPSGVSISLVATPTTGYHFVNWTESGTEVSQSATYTFSASANRTLVANFVANAVTVSSDINATTLINCATCDVTVSSGTTLTVDASKTFNTVMVAPGAKLTLGNGNTLTAGTLTLQSNATTTATFVDNNVAGQAITATVQQYLAGSANVSLPNRNWYVSVPVTTANVSALSTASSVVCWDEPTGAWAAPSASTLNSLRGYISVGSTANSTISFTGTLNSGPKSIVLTRTKNATKEGFNLVGNPYPSYVSWASATKTNLDPTIWFRTQNAGGAYVFDTFNGVGTNNNGTGEVTAQIPPMQAFWVRVLAAGDGNSTTGTLAFDNTMRSHETGTNKLKAPASKSANQQVLRLQVSNGTNSDETIVLFNSNASNGFDNYDSPKMTNGNAAIPEIYTTAGSENLVINGLNSLTSDEVLPLGFTTGAANSFTLKATEFSNFDSSVRLILKDNALNTETDITDGTAYTFSSIAINTTNRFSLIFRTSSLTTKNIDNFDVSGTLRVYQTENGQIAVDCPLSTFGQVHVSVYNAIGQLQEASTLISTKTVLDRNFSSGVYMVNVVANGKNVVRKVVIND